MISMFPTDAAFPSKLSYEWFSPFTSTPRSMKCFIIEVDPVLQTSDKKGYTSSEFDLRIWLSRVAIPKNVSNRISAEGDRSDKDGERWWVNSIFNRCLKAASTCANAPMTQICNRERSSSNQGSDVLNRRSGIQSIWLQRELMRSSKTWPASAAKTLPPCFTYLFRDFRTSFWMFIPTSRLFFTSWPMTTSLKAFRRFLSGLAREWKYLLTRKGFFHHEIDY